MSRIGRPPLAPPLVRGAGGPGAAHGAARGAVLAGLDLAPQLRPAVSLERDAELPHGLRAPAHDPVLVDVQVAAAGAALERGVGAAEQPAAVILRLVEAAAVRPAQLRVERPLLPRQGEL